MLLEAWHISLLCILYLYVVKYQKYKSDELGDQLLEALTFIARQFCPVEKIFGTILHPLKLINGHKSPRVKNGKLNLMKLLTKHGCDLHPREVRWS